MSTGDGHPDVVVVGGGIAGSATAYELARRDADVVLVDRLDPGRASDAGAGILSPETTWHTEAAWYPFVAEAGNHFPTLVESLRADGASDPGYSRCGLVTVSVSEGDAPWFADLAALAVDRGAGAVREITPEEARQTMPALGEVRRALLNEAAARIDGRAVTVSLQGAGSNRGVRQLAGDVTGFTRDGDRVVAVRTSAGDLPCGAVVLATGAWSEPAGRLLGVRLPIRPIKGQIIHLQAEPTPEDPWPIVQPVLGHYLVPWPDGRVACGGTFEEQAGLDPRPTAAGVAELLRECLHLAPGLASATFLEVRVGFRPFSGDDLPVVGRLPGLENGFACTGHGADGLLAGPYSGSLVAALVTGQVDGLSPAARTTLEAFDPGRFANSTVT